MRNNSAFRVGASVLLGLALLSSMGATAIQLGPRPVFPLTNVAAMSANAAKVAWNGDLVRTSGYTTAGDGGGNEFIYRRTGRSGVTADGGWIIAGPLSDDYFEATNKTLVHAKQWGCRGDNSTDDTVRAQAALDAGEANDVPVYFPAANYVTSDTLWVTGSDSESDDTTFRRAVLYGDSPGYAESTTQLRTAIICSAKDRPALAIQRGRGVTIRNLQIVGPNAAPASNDAADSDRADWLTTDVQHTQYAPQAGICIDPCLASSPGGGAYSAFTYAGSSEGSNGTVIEGVELRGHAVGFCVRPDGGLSNNDQIALRNVQFFRCATGVGLGNSQIRSGSAWSHLAFSQCHTSLDTRSFGDGQGVLPGITGMQVGDCWRVLNLNSAFGTGSITNLYVESTNWLGIIGESASGSTGPFLIVNAQLNRWDSLDETTACPFWMVCNRPVTFIGGRTEQGHQDADLLSIGGGWSPTFDGHQFTNTNDDGGVRVIGYDLNGYCLPIHRNCTVRADTKVVPLSVDAFNRGVSIGVANQSLNRFWAARSTGVFQNGDSTNLRTFKWANSDWRVRDTTATSIDVTAGVLTFDTTDEPFWMVGDYIYGNCADPEGEVPATYIVPLFKVTDITSGTVTARVIGEAAWCSAFSNIQTAQPEWAPVVDFEGDTTSSSATISNTTHDGVVEVGDWITGAGIPSNTRVTAVDDGANTITLSRNATATATGVQLYWGRMHNVTTSATY